MKGENRKCLKTVEVDVRVIAFLPLLLNFGDAFIVPHDFVAWQNYNSILMSLDKPKILSDLLCYSVRSVHMPDQLLVR